MLLLHFRCCQINKMEHTCSMCPYFGNTTTVMLAHLVKKHPHNLNFTVHCRCGVSYRNYKSFQIHCSRKHFMLSTDNLQTDLPSFIDKDENTTTNDNVCNPNQIY